MQTHARIVAALRGGDTASALKDIDALLAADPQDAELLGLKGLALALGGRLAEAAGFARKALANAQTPDQRIKHAGNLARLLGSDPKHRHELADVAQMEFPLLADLSDGELDAAALQNLCTPLALAGHNGFVAGFLAPVMNRPFVTWELEQLWLRAAAADNRHDRILDRFQTASYRWHDKPEAIGFAAAAATELGRHDTARHLVERYVALARPKVFPRRPTQTMTVVLITATPQVSALVQPPERQPLASNFPSQLAAQLADRYRFIAIFPGSPAGAATAEIAPGEAAITLNNCVNGEDLKRGALATVEAQERALGLEVVNAAAKAVHCTRVETAEMLRGIDNLIVPKALRFRLQPELLPALRLRIAEMFSFPVILRSVGEQEGANVHLASNEAELGATLEDLLSLGNRDVYVIQYAGVQHANGFFRRIRAAFVAGAPTLMRADYDDQWLVRGRKFERILDHYRRDRALFDAANAVVQQPEHIGEAAWNALREVGRRMPLDVFGMDFDVDQEGRVVFFEANATMLLLSNAPPDLDYPPEAQAAFLKKLDALFLRRAGISLQ